MANSVTFPVELGGTGETITDDSHPTTGLGQGGHRLRFVRALSGAVAMARSAVNAAGQASNATTQASANAIAAAQSAYAATQSSLLAEKWAIQETGPVSGNLWSAKVYADRAASSVALVSSGVGLGRIDGGDSMTTVYSRYFDFGTSNSTPTEIINGGNSV